MRADTSRGAVGGTSVKETSASTGMPLITSQRLTHTVTNVGSSSSATGNCSSSASATVLPSVAALTNTVLRSSAVRKTIRGHASDNGRSMPVPAVSSEPIATYTCRRPVDVGRGSDSAVLSEQPAASEATAARTANQENAVRTAVTFMPRPPPGRGAGPPAAPGSRRPPARARGTGGWGPPCPRPPPRARGNGRVGDAHGGGGEGDQPDPRQHDL